MPAQWRTAAAILIATTAVGAASACNPFNRRGPVPGEGPAVVVFENQSLFEAGVYAVPRGGVQVRIGTVPAGQTDTLTVGGTALSASGTVTLVARLLADGRTPNSGPLTLQPGDRIVVTLPPQANVLSVLPAR